MTPHRAPAPAFQFVHEHAVFANPGVKGVNATFFSDSFTAWRAFLNHAGKPRAVAQLASNTLPAAVLAEGYLGALQAWQDKWG